VSPSLMVDRSNPQCLLDICAHVWPIDMLRLSRTCRTFRQVLMSKTCQAVWKASFENTFLADRLSIVSCPSSLSQPAWASLLYEKICQVHIDVCYTGYS
jgi:hypothetical protein